MSALLESSRRLAETVAPTALLGQILDDAARLSGSSDGAIILFDPRRESLYFAAAIGLDAAVVMERFGMNADEQIPLKGSKAGQVYVTGEPVFENHIADHFSDVDEARRSGDVTGSMICVPLTAAALTGGDPRLGVMQLLNKRDAAGRSIPYESSDLDLLMAFANHAALALRNSRLITRLLATTGLGRPETETDLRVALADLDGAPRNEYLTILFADMRGYTPLAARVGGLDRLVELTNDFLTMLSDVIGAHQGTVNKFIGDGVLALFRGDEHEQRAVRSAFEMRQRFAVLKERWRNSVAARIEFVDLGVGIATETVTLGTVGSGVARDFTAIGQPVNLAAALEFNARGGRFVLVDHLTFLGARDLIGEYDGPEVFELRKPDQRTGTEYDIYHLRSLKGQEDRAKVRVFISHSSDDKAEVERLIVEPLKAAGVDIWYDSESIRLLDNWVDALGSGLRECQRVVIVVSERSIKSRWVHEEVSLALSLPHLAGSLLCVSLDESEPNAINEFLGTRQMLRVAETPDASARIVRALAG
jgi:class 3 adenylate cyclase